MKHRRRQLQEINAGSMADIAFLLLIFFLVTTTLGTSTGMQRKLSPMPEDDQKKTVDMKKRNVMTVLINKDNIIAVGGNPTELSQLSKITEIFLKNPDNNPDLPEKTLKNIQFFGDVYVSKGIISLQSDRGTSYQKYLQVQNELSRAVNNLRNEASLQQFGIEYDELSEEKKLAVQKVFPLSVSEAEPREIIEK